MNPQATTSGSAREQCTQGYMHKFVKGLIIIIREILLFSYFDAWMHILHVCRHYVLTYDHSNLLHAKIICFAGIVFKSQYVGAIFEKSESIVRAIFEIVTQMLEQFSDKFQYSVAHSVAFWNKEYSPPLLVFQCPILIFFTQNMSYI